jgi:dihydrofolate synthase/folylpolyglutamate synthase
LNEYITRLNDLFKLEFFGMKLGLDNIRALLEALDGPHRKFQSIHIAGTNGKGSTAAMLAAVHQVCGRKTGLYTSPHLVDFRERIRIDGELISEREVAEFLGRIWPKVEELNATFFEVTTAMAFDHFARHLVDVAIIETGLGGRLDATNVLEQPLATVITSIGYDHMQQLGPTLESIASEKAGIFKQGIPAVVNCAPELKPLFKERAESLNAPFTFVRNFRLPVMLRDLAPSLRGEHQRQNLRTVLATLEAINFNAPIETIRKGIRETSILTGIRGRLEPLRLPEYPGVQIILDVGHNDDALQRVRDCFLKESVRPVAVFGIMRDKDIQRALGILKEFVSRLIAVAADTHRALPSDELHVATQAMGISSSDGGTVEQGVKIALNSAIPGDIILISGSHYVCGEFLKNFEPAQGVERGEHKAQSANFA